VQSRTPAQSLTRLGTIALVLLARHVGPQSAYLPHGTTRQFGDGNPSEVSCCATSGDFARCTKGSARLASRSSGLQVIILSAAILFPLHLTSPGGFSTCRADSFILSRPLCWSAGCLDAHPVLILQVAWLTFRYPRAGSSALSTHAPAVALLQRACSQFTRSSRTRRNCEHKD